MKLLALLSESWSFLAFMNSRFFVSRILLILFVKRVGLLCVRCFSMLAVKLILCSSLILVFSSVKAKKHLWHRRIYVDLKNVDDWRSRNISGVILGYNFRISGWEWIALGSTNFLGIGTCEPLSARCYMTWFGVGTTSTILSFFFFSSTPSCCILSSAAAGELN